MVVKTRYFRVQRPHQMGLSCTVSVHGSFIIWGCGRAVASGRGRRACWAGHAGDRSEDRMSADIVIRGGTLIDGTGAPSRAADVAITDGVISDIGDKLDGKRVLEADGNV